MTKREQYGELARLLLQASEAGMAEWSVTPDPDTFRAIFPAGFVKVTKDDRDASEGPNGSLYRLTTVSRHAVPTGEWEPTEADDLRLLEELHSVAKRSARVVDPTYDALLENLKAMLQTSSARRAMPAPVLEEPAQR